MFKCFCDICEKEIKDKTALEKSDYGMILGKNNYDLCEECYNDIRHYVSIRHNNLTGKTVFERMKGYESE